MTSPNEKVQGDNTDAIMIGTALQVAIELTELIAKYQSDDIQVPAIGAVQAHIARIQALAPLVEVYDEGVVHDIMSGIKTSLGLK